MAYVDIGGYSYNTGAYGSGDFGSANFQTVVSSTATVDASELRIRSAESTVSPSASVSCDSEKIHQGDAIASAVSLMDASGAISVVGSAATAANASVTATCNRVLSFDASLSSTSSLSCNGREKWEPILKVSEIWTEIA